ncbi:MAG: lipoate--protein ligase [Lentisphaerota bacterium]
MSERIVVGLSDENLAEAECRGPNSECVAALCECDPCDQGFPLAAGVWYISTMLIVRADSLDAWRNLAMEEYLIGQVARYEAILFLWQCSDTVVIGKNQNPWSECNLQALASGKGKLARRLSGGGAVFHDPGNLNFSFILAREHFSYDFTFSIILSALARMGVKAVRNERNGLMVDGGKISGNAFCFRKNAAMHHGTLLVDADLKKLERYLDPVLPALQTRAVRSIGDPVMNLRSLKPRWTCNKIAEGIATEFRKATGVRKSAGNFSLNEHELSRLTLKYGSRDWLYGETPDFEVSLGNRFQSLDFFCSMTVHQGHIQQVRVTSKTDPAPWLGELPVLLKGCRFESASIAACLRGQSATLPFRDQVIAWILSLHI